MRGTALPCIGLRILPDMRLGAVRLVSRREPEPRAMSLFATDQFSTSHGTVLPVLADRLRGTKFVELPVRSVINAPEATGMGFWSLNPYVGCEFGCSYCYARFAHRYVVERARDAGTIDASAFTDLGAPTGLESFEHRILVKSREGVLAALERDLLRVRRRTARDGAQSILIGTATDPYQPAERQYQITRTVLARLLDEAGLRVGIITKSPLVCRDIGLLKQLSQRHTLSVYVSLISMDPDVTRLFEARSPMPSVRLRALARLSAAGLRAGIIVAPILPGITDTVDQIRALLRAGRDMGARFVYPSPLRLYPGVRQRLLPILERHFPMLAPRYLAAYRNGWDAADTYCRAVRRRFHRLATAYGIPDIDGGHEHADGEPPRSTQLSLFEAA